MDYRIVPFETYRLFGGGLDEQAFKRVRSIAPTDAERVKAGNEVASVGIHFSGPGDLECFAAVTREIPEESLGTRLLETYVSAGVQDSSVKSWLVPLLEARGHSSTL